MHCHGNVTCNGCGVQWMNDTDFSNPLTFTLEPPQARHFCCWLNILSTVVRLAVKFDADRKNAISKERQRTIITLKSVGLFLRETATASVCVQCPTPSV